MRLLQGFKKYNILIKIYDRKQFFIFWNILI